MLRLEYSITHCSGPCTHRPLFLRRVCRPHARGQCGLQCRGLGSDALAGRAGARCEAWPLGLPPVTGVTALLCFSLLLLPTVLCAAPAVYPPSFTSRPLPSPSPSPSFTVYSVHAAGVICIRPCSMRRTLLQVQRLLVLMVSHCAMCAAIFPDVCHSNLSPSLFAVCPCECAPR
jgi:hypothetical protein